MDDVNALFSDAIAAFPGGYPEHRRDIALTYSDGSWSCEAGNTCPAVHVCEAGGDWQGAGATAADALRSLIANMKDRPNGRHTAR